MGEHWIQPVETPLCAFHVAEGGRALQQRLEHGNSWEYRSTFEFIFMRETDNGPKNALCPRFDTDPPAHAPRITCSGNEQKDNDQVHGHRVNQQCKET